MLHNNSFTEGHFTYIYIVIQTPSKYVAALYILQMSLVNYNPQLSLHCTNARCGLYSVGSCFIL